MSCEIMLLDNRHHDYLRDQSGLVGQADTISFPESEAEVCRVIAEGARRGMPITIQGSRTGLSGGAVPAGGHVLSLTRMQRIVGMQHCGDNHFALRVQAGLPLVELKRYLQSRRADSTGWDRGSMETLATFSGRRPHFWPPDPTEESASVGGIAANDSRGPTSYLYGSARRYIRSIRVVDTDGNPWRIERGHHCFRQWSCVHPNGRLLSLTRQVSALSGIAAEPELVDLYLGSEGILGPITELTLELLPQPEDRWAVVLFFAVEFQAATFIDALRSCPGKPPEACLAAVDFFDAATLDRIAQLKRGNSRLAVLPGWPVGTEAAVYVELHGAGAQALEELAAWLLEAALGNGCEPENALAFVGEQEVARARLLCHGALEAMHPPGVREVANAPPSAMFMADMGKAGWSFAELLGMYRSDLRRAGLPAAIFGHAGDLRLQVRFKEDAAQASCAGQHLIEGWSRRVHDAGGYSIAGYGLGKRRDLFAGSLQHSGRVVMLKCLKRQLDPTGLFNPGTVFDGRDGGF